MSTGCERQLRDRAPVAATLLGAMTLATSATLALAPAAGAMEPLVSKTSTTATSTIATSAIATSTIAPALCPAEPSAAPDISRAAELYAARCAVCHGASGEGDGPAARFLRPRPRNFVEARYRLRSTPTGELPTSADLFATITRGIPGTAMPPWGGLSCRDRASLALLLESMSPRFQSEPRAAPIVDTPPPPRTPARLARGAAVYVELGCARCHGDDGRGRGTAADEDLLDDSGHVAHPFDLTRGWKTKSGTDARALHRAFVTGLDGTPMPAYADGASDDDLWSLAFFVESLWLDRPIP